MSLPPEPPVPVTPPPSEEGAPLICGLQRQVQGGTRGFRPEGSREWLLIATLEGEGRARAEGRDWTLAPGDLLLIEPGRPQDYGHLHDEADWVNVWTHFRPRPHWLPWLAWSRIGRGIFLLHASECWPEIRPELLRMVETARRPVRLRHDVALNSLERVLLACDEVNPLHRASDIDPRVRTALEIVGERLAAPLDVEGLSREVGLSRSRFSVLFAAETRMSPQSYIEYARLSRAAQMLALSSWPIGQIAEQVGFPNAYYFSTRFRKRYGVPPTVYRHRFDRRATAPQP